MLERGVVYVWQNIWRGEGRWVLGLAFARWQLYPYSKILIPVLLARMSSHNCASRFHQVLSMSSILRCLASTSKENTKQRMENSHNQSKKENIPRWVGFIWLEGLLLGLSLFCQFEVRLNGGNPPNRVWLLRVRLRWCGYLAKTRPYYYISLLCESERKPDQVIVNDLIDSYRSTRVWWG
jgi:hypothetical protein